MENSIYDENSRAILLSISQKSIENGLANREPPEINLNNFPLLLREIGASFVTLYLNGELRGCIGTISAYQPLIENIAQNAFSAAFNDPRFPPLTEKELEKITIEISVLSRPEPMEFSNEQDLLSKIKPHEDGLILSDQGRSSTFLPSVWEQLPEPGLFFQRLKLKAGLPMDYWSETLTVQRYSVVNWGSGG